MKKLTIIVASVILLSSCADWFDISDDNSDNYGKEYFKDESAFLNALTGVYTHLRTPMLYGENLSLGVLEFMGQNFVPQTQEQKDFASFDYSAQRMKAREIWQNMYIAISNCNELIENIENTSIVFQSNGQKQIIAGEAYALRAVMHFDLLRLFHPSPAVDRNFKGMPYMTRFSDKVSAPLTTDQVLECVISDLIKASELLVDSDPILNGWHYGTVTPGVIDSRLRTFFMNYYATTASLARVYLYAGNNAKALQYANETFTHLTKVDRSKQLFFYFAAGQYGSDLSFSREHIFGVSSTPDGFRQVSETLFVESSVEVRAGLTSLFDNANDTRYRTWFKLIGSEFIMSPKFGKESILIDYKGKGEDNNLPARIPFIKLSEVALIAAEAMNDGVTPLTQAAAPIITLQTNRDISDVRTMVDDNSITRQKLSEAIEKEYKRDFFGEGQLFYYYKRCNKSSVERFDGVSRDMRAADYTMPIPQGGVSL